MQKKWYVYLLECQDSSFYTGVTKDIDVRIKAHKSGRGSKYVYTKGFNKLLRIKLCKNKSDAYKCEFIIKQLPRNKKLSWFN